ncbi:MAG: NADH-dependent dyhydrogenase, partial [uncultured Rubrobacteraceae bacterium]
RDVRGRRRHGPHGPRRRHAALRARRRGRERLRRGRRLLRHRERGRRRHPDAGARRGRRRRRLRDGRSELVQGPGLPDLGRLYPPHHRHLGGAGRGRLLPEHHHLRPRVRRNLLDARRGGPKRAHARRLSHGGRSDRGRRRGRVAGAGGGAGGVPFRGEPRARGRRAKL